MRRTLLLAALAVAAPLFLAPTAHAHPSVEARRVAPHLVVRPAGVRSVTLPEARQLRQAQAHVRRLVAQARRDGVITRPERRAIARAMARRDALVAQVRHHSHRRNIG